MWALRALSLLPLCPPPFFSLSLADADFTPVLTEGKVDIIFTGHYHYYSRYRVRSALLLSGSCSLTTLSAFLTYLTLPPPRSSAALQQHDWRGG